MIHRNLPTARAEAVSGLSGDILPAFIEHLRATGLSAGRIGSLRPSAQHFLTWLGLCGIAVESIDDAVLRSFRRHDCHCPGMRRERHKMLTSPRRQFLAGALRVVQFLEDQGSIPHPGELDANLGHLDDFIVRCTAEGYRPDVLVTYRCSCRHVLFWLHRSRISIREVDAETLEHFSCHDCVCPGAFRSLRQRVTGSRYDYPFRSFLLHLAETGVLPVQSVTSKTRAGSAMGPFKAWLRRHRGIGEDSIHKHAQRAALLVAELGPDPRSYDAKAIREALLRLYDENSPSLPGKLASSMRMYLRYLAANGICSPSLIDAVPAATSWRLSSLPRYIGPEDVEHVIACCAVTTPAGLRDKAILLLLARLALRAGDVVALGLEDIDWRNALVRVCGKSKRQEALPLPQDAGDAILAYIETARPRVADDKVFLRALAPHRPLASSGSVTGIVIRALKRAGLEEARPQGAHLFRHSAATNMVRSGQSLEAIAALLRHQSMETTTIYAKTNKPMLLEVAQPWIGGRP